jgi:hypothetical protein
MCGCILSHIFQIYFTPDNDNVNESFDIKIDNLFVSLKLRYLINRE